MNGFLDQLSRLPEVTKQVQDKGKQTNVTLVPILSEFQIREEEVKINFKNATIIENLKIKPKKSNIFGSGGHVPGTTAFLQQPLVFKFNLLSFDVSLIYKRILSPELVM